MANDEKLAKQFKKVRELNELAEKGKDGNGKSHFDFTDFFRKKNEITVIIPTFQKLIDENPEEKDNPNFVWKMGYVNSVTMLSEGMLPISLTQSVGKMFSEVQPDESGAVKREMGDEDYRTMGTWRLSRLVARMVFPRFTLNRNEAGPEIVYAGDLKDEDLNFLLQKSDEMDGFVISTGETVEEAKKDPFLGETEEYSGESTHPVEDIRPEAIEVSERG